MHSHSDVSDHSNRMPGLGSGVGEGVCVFVMLPTVTGCRQGVHSHSDVVVHCDSMLGREGKVYTVAVMLLPLCCDRMSGGENKVELQEVLPKQGLVYQEDMPTVVLCKPKLLPLKSVTLEKMEKMQKEAMEEVKAQELKELGQDAEMFKGY